MTNRLQAAILTTASALALLPAPPAAAQQTAQASAGLEEIVVTARRREENAQSVPIAITAVDSKLLERHDIHTVTDLERIITGINVCCNRNSTAFSAVRGVRGLLAYFAEVPSNFSSSNVYFDLGSVSALKGPQGTLFGLSANAGVLLYEPRRPTDQIEVSASATIGNYDRRTFEAVVNVPIVAEKLLFRAGVQRHDQDGYLFDVRQQRDVSDEHYWNMRASAIFKPTDSFQNYTMINWFRSKDHGNPYRLIAVNPTGTALRLFPTLNALNAQQHALGRYNILGSDHPLGTKGIVTRLNLVDTATLELTDDLTLKNIFGYLEDGGYSRTDIEGTTLPINAGGYPGSVFNAPSPQYSDEVQLQGRAFGKLTYTLGTFHLWTETKPRGIVYGMSLGSISGTINRTRQASHALYGQATYDLSDFVEGLEFTAGYRYTWDQREASQVRYSAAGVPLQSFSAKGNFKAPSYTLSASYKINPDTMIYVTNAKGYSAGGFNLTAPPQLQKFNPESLNNVEVGVKSDFAMGDVKARVNLSAYYGWVDNQQVTITQGVQTATGIQLATVTANAAVGHIKGIDAEATLIPIPELELSANIALVKGIYDTFNTGTRDLSGTDYVFTPKTKGGVHAVVHLPVPADLGGVDLNIDWIWQGRSLISSEIHPPGLGLDHSQPYNVTNASIDWRDIGGYEGISASVFMTNIFNNKTGIGQFGAYNAIGIWSEYVAPPMMYGVRLRYTYN